MCPPYHNLHWSVRLYVYLIMNSDTSAGTPAFIAGNATVTGDVSIADDVSIWYGAVIRADKDRIAILGGSNIQDNAVVHTTAGCPVTIGKDVSVGHGAIIHGAVIRDRVLVGMGAIVMNNAVIGEDSVIAAGSVVTEGKEIPPPIPGDGCAGQSHPGGIRGTDQSHRGKCPFLCQTREGDEQWLKWQSSAAAWPAYRRPSTLQTMVSGCI